VSHREKKGEARVPGGGGDLLIAGGGGGANPGAVTPVMSTRSSFQEPEVEDDPGNWAGPCWAAPEEEGKEEELGYRPKQGRIPLFFVKTFF
jgi:hypothetical protein